MKTILFFITFIGLSFFCSSQNKYLPLRDVFGQEVIDSIENQYDSKAYRLIVYNRFFDDFDYDAILIISNYQKTMYWCIRDDSVVFSGTLSSNTIFLYKNYQKTGAIEKEKFSGDTFIPPVLCGANTENVIYKDNNISFYFEYGDNLVSHEELPERKKYREEWLKIIRKDLDSIIDCK